jgi:hypothetical protein
MIPIPDPDSGRPELNRFVDADAGSERHLNFAPPVERELEMTPEPFEGEEPESARSRGPTIIILVLIALVVAGVAAYMLRGGRPAQTVSTKPPVAATTVDLPQTPSTVPPEPALPAPAPSRPASGAASPERNQMVAGRGRLLIRSTPAEADISINGLARGKTPLTARDLPLGSYTIHLSRNGFVSTDRKVLLTARRPSESLEVSLKPTASPARTSGPAPAASSESRGGISVESRPPGARVFVNDRLVGSTPLAIPGLPAGAATVRIELEGYQPWVTRIRVGAGDETRVTASLERK